MYEWPSQFYRLCVGDSRNHSYTLVSCPLAVAKRQPFKEKLGHSGLRLHLSPLLVLMGLLSFFLALHISAVSRTRSVGLSPLVLNRAIRP